MLPSSMTVALFTDGKGEVKRNSVKICKHLKYCLCTSQSLWGTQKCIKVVPPSYGNRVIGYRSSKE